MVSLNGDTIKLTGITTEVDNTEKADCMSNLSAQANLSRSFLSSSAAAFSGLRES